MKKLTSVMMLLLLFVATNIFAQNTGSVKFKFSIHNDYYGWDVNNLKGTRLIILGNNIDWENPIIVEGEEEQELILSNLLPGDYWATVQQYPLGHEEFEDEMGNMQQDFHFYIQERTTSECYIPCKQIDGIRIKVIDEKTNEAIAGIPFHVFSHMIGFDDQRITDDKGEINITEFDSHMIVDIAVNCLNIPEKYLLANRESHSFLQYRPEDVSSREIRFVFEEKPSCRLSIDESLIDEYDDVKWTTGRTSHRIEDLTGLIIGLYDTSNNLVRNFHGENLYWDGNNYRLYYEQEGQYKLKIDRLPKGFRQSSIVTFKLERDITLIKGEEPWAAFEFVGINYLNINALDINTNEPVEDAQFRVTVDGVPHFIRTTDRYGKALAPELSYNTESIKCVTVPMGYQLVGNAIQDVSFDKSYTSGQKDVTYYFEKVGATQHRDTCELKALLYRSTRSNGLSCGERIFKPKGFKIKVYDEIGTFVKSFDYDEQYPDEAELDTIYIGNVRPGYYWVKLENNMNLEGGDGLSNKVDSIKIGVGRFKTKDTYSDNPYRCRWVEYYNLQRLYYKGGDSLKINALDANTNEPLQGAWFSIYSDLFGLICSHPYESRRTTNENGELLVEYLPWDVTRVVNDSCPEGYRLMGNPTQNVSFTEGSPSLKELTYYYVKVKEAPQLLGHIQINLPTTHMYSVKTGESFQVYAWLSDTEDTGIGLYDQNGNFLEDITVSHSGSVYTCMIPNRTGTLMINPFYIDEMGDKKPVIRPENSYFVDKLPLAVEINWNTRNYAASEDVSLSRSMRIRTSVNNLHRVENEETFRLSLNLAPASNDVQIGLFDLWGNFHENILRSKSGANYVCAVSWDIWGDDYIIMPYVMENGSMKIVERALGEPVIDRLPLYVDDGFGAFSVRNAMGVESSNTESKISFYPNPVIDKITINTNEAIKRVQILDMNSKLLLSVDSESSDIDLSTLNRGVYILKVITDKSVKSFKMNKE